MGNAIAWRRLKALAGVRKPAETRQVAWVNPSDLTVFTPSAWEAPIATWEAMQVAAVHASVTMISDHIGNLPWAGWRADQELFPQPTVLRRPDPFHPVEATRRQSVVNMLTKGAAAYFLSEYNRDGKPTTATLIRPIELSVAWNESRTRRQFRWRGRTFDEYPEGSPGSQILYVPMFLYPDDPLEGYGPVQLARATIREALAQDRFARDFFTRGAVVDGVLMVPDDLDPPEVDTLRQQWDTQQGGRRGPPVVTGGADFKPTTYSNRNSQLVESRFAMVGSIARFFGIPALLLNAGLQGANLYYTTQEGIWTEYIRTALQPVMGRLAVAFGELLPSTTEVRFKTDQLQRADISVLSTSLKTLTDAEIITDNEAREIFGLPPLEGGGSVPSDPAPAEVPTDA